jgi:hypothetical protein
MESTGREKCLIQLISQVGNPKETFYVTFNDGSMNSSALLRELSSQTDRASRSDGGGMGLPLKPGNSLRRGERKDGMTVGNHTRAPALLELCGQLQWAS